MDEIIYCKKCNGTDFTEIAENQYECQECYEIAETTGVKK